MKVKVVSFGYRHRQPPEGFTVFDCRHLPNPHQDCMLRLLNGKDKRVLEYIMERGSERVYKLQVDALQRGRKGESVAFGCFGGRHRSVAMAEQVALNLRRVGVEAELDHLDL